MAAGLRAAGWDALPTTGVSQALSGLATPRRRPRPSHARRLVVFAAFNSFPDYNEAEGWEGSLKVMSKACCCASVLEAKQDQSGVTGCALGQRGGGGPPLRADLEPVLSSHKAIA